MAAGALGSGPFDRSLTNWWAHHSHRYLLPIVGGVALGAGTAFTLLAPVHVVVPPAGILLLLGAATLSVSMITTALRIRLETDWAARPTPAPAPAAPTCPACAEPSESHHSAHLLLRQIEIWNVLRRRGASAAFASTTGATPSDFMWSSWVSAASTLPVALVGPVPETAYIPPEPGSIDRFPEHGVPQPPPAWDDVPVGPTRNGTPRAIPGPDGVGFVDARAAAPVSVPDLGAAYGRMADRSGAFAGFDLMGPAGPSSPGGLDRTSELDLTGLDPVRREALTPTPPHLRPAAAAKPTAPSRPNPPPDPASQPPFCATCEQRIPSPAGWRRCPDCYRPICPDCIVAALLEQDRGWCERCAEAHLGSDLPIAS